MGPIKAETARACHQNRSRPQSAPLGIAEFLAMLGQVGRSVRAGVVNPHAWMGNGGGLRTARPARRYAKVQLDRQRSSRRRGRVSTALTSPALNGRQEECRNRRRHNPLPHRIRRGGTSQRDAIYPLRLSGFMGRKRSWKRDRFFGTDSLVKLTAITGTHFSDRGSPCQKWTRTLTPAGRPID